MAKGKGKRKVGAGDVVLNRYASHRYELIERLECGLVLEGTEVKSLRASGAQLKDGYAAIGRGAVAVHRLHPALRARLAREPRSRASAQAACAPPRARSRRRARERARAHAGAHPHLLLGLAREVEIALARGKDLYDKRQSIRERETKRDMERAVREAHR